MALTKVSGGILDPGISVAGVVTATGFDGPFIGGSDGINAGVGTFTGLDVNGNGDISGNLVIGGNLTANGDFTTLNTTLREVELLRVDANSSAIAGIITQRGSGDIFSVYDTSTEVFKIADGGQATFTGDVELTSTDSGGAAAPTLRLQRDSSSPVNGDILGQIMFGGKDSTPNDENYASVAGKIINSGAGGEHGAIQITTRKASSNVITANLTSTDYELLNGTNLSVDGNITGNGNFILRSTDGGTAAAPELTLHRNSGSPANNDYLGEIHFRGKDSGGSSADYATITGKILSTTNGAERGILEFSHLKSGTETITGRWQDDGLQLLNSTNLSVAGIATVTTRLNINTVSGTRLAVAGTNYPWRGMFMIKDTTTGSGAQPYMTFWEGSEAIDGSNTGLLGRVGHVNGGNTNERFDFWTYRSTTPISLGTNGYERLRILPAGQTLITSNTSGNSISARTVLTSYTPALQIEGVSKSSTSASLTANVNNTVGPSLWFAKTRGTSLGSNTAVQDDDELGTIVFNGADGTDIQTMGAYIRGVVDGSVSSNDVPGRLQFHTATGGTMYERVQIDSSGRVLIGRSSAYGHVDADNLIVGDEAVNEHQGITILSHSGKYGGIYFGDGDGATGSNRGKIIYDHPNDQLRIGVGGAAATQLYLNSAGEVGISVSPSSGHLLHVKNSGSADSKVKIESESGHDARLILDTSNGGGAGGHIDFQID